MSVNLELEAGSQFGLEVHSQLLSLLLSADEFLWVGQELSQKNLENLSLASLGDLPLPP